MQVLPIAQLLAADLAGARVDPNEAQKALAYLRKQQDEKQFFAYLRAIVQDGRAVIRSGQTLDYYRNLLAACERHLRGMRADEMALTLGWAIRLLRYYKTVPEAAREKAAQARPPEGGTKTADRRPPTDTRSATPTADRRPPQPPEGGTTTADRRPPTAGKALPAVGDTFTGKVLERDDTAVVVQVPGFDANKVFALLKVEPGVPKYRPGKDSARVEVTGVRQLKSGKTVVEVQRAARRSQDH